MRSGGAAFYPDIQVKKARALAGRAIDAVLRMELCLNDERCESAETVVASALSPRLST